MEFRQLLAGCFFPDQLNNVPASPTAFQTGRPRLVVLHDHYLSTALIKALNDSITTATETTRALSAFAVAK
jgi:hypothetical protein